MPGSSCRKATPAPCAPLSPGCATTRESADAWARWGGARVLELFTQEAIARRTFYVYQQMLAARSLAPRGAMPAAPWRGPRAYRQTAARVMNVLIGYGYHPVTTATYLQRALERRAATTFVGTPWGSQPGFAATGEIAEIVADLPGCPTSTCMSIRAPRGICRAD